MDRFCTLDLDEMAITPDIIFKSVQKKILISSLGRCYEIANYALVFMLKGHKSELETTRSITFYKRYCKKQKVIGAVQLTGSKIICTISDLGTTNFLYESISRSRTRKNIYRLFKSSQLPNMRERMWHQVTSRVFHHKLSFPSLSFHSL